MNVVLSMRRYENIRIFDNAQVKRGFSEKTLSLHYLCISHALCGENLSRVSDKYSEDYGRSL